MRMKLLVAVLLLETVALVALLIVAGSRNTSNLGSVVTPAAATVQYLAAHCPGS
jgi:hypothetical protein